MKKIFVWPILLLLIHLYLVSRSKSGSLVDPLGLASAGIGIFEIFLISSILIYLPLILLYIFFKKKKGYDLNIWVCLGIGAGSFILSPLFLKVPAFLRIANAIFTSHWWWLNFN